MDVNWTSCRDHFAVYTNIKLLRCIPETNVMSAIPQEKKNNEGKCKKIVLKII